MTLFKPYSKIVTLLIKFLQGTSTDEEIAELEQWRQSDKQNEKLYQKLLSETFWTQNQQQHYQARLINSWLNLEHRHKQQLRRRTIRKITAVAAGILLPALFLVWLIPEKNSPEYKESAETIHPGKARAELVLADGSEIQLGANIPAAELKKEGIEIDTATQHIIYREEKETQEIEYHTLRIPRGGEFNITLGDGTKVYLNSVSELHYPLQFGKDERRIQFSGEAYFEVARDESRPFIIESNATSVEVLGTTFNLRSYRDEQQIVTTLVEGKVRFSAGDRQLILNPGEQGVADASLQLSKQAVNTRHYTAWKDGLFVFRSQRLETIMNTIARWYNVEVYFATPSQKDIVFSGNVKRYDDFSKITEMLEIPGDIKFEIKGRTIIIH